LAGACVCCVKTTQALAFLAVFVYATQAIVFEWKPGLSRSAWVGRSKPSVSLFVCLQHNSRTNDPKVFKRGVWNDLGIS